MKVALAQIAPRLGDVGRNLETHLEFINKARRAKVDLLVFPELSLTGYTLKDLAGEVALDPATDPRFKKILDRSRGLSVVLGFMEESASAKGLFYNAAAFLSEGKILHVHRKVFLPTNGLFEEAKFFAQGRDFQVFPTPFGKAGLLICRDFLHYGASYVLFAGGADVIIAISAAPGRGVAGAEDAFETSRMWELMGEAMSYFSTAFVLYANRVGVEDGVSFAGGSFIYDPAGRLVARAAYLDPEFLVRRLDLAAVREARTRRLFRRDEKPEAILRSLERVVRVPQD
ncbi:MAG TPA: nitrilase-related carbon-nitrogen hydrolase [Burkholderiales bacterium]|nr:nitrilase-related carbon-nitrogen hydrolase [Burkholderiales bacterium]